MPTLKPATKFLLGLTALLTLAGCAQSPQQVRLDPVISVNTVVENQPTVHLSITDKRPSQSLGTRGGVYRDSNHITLAQPISRSLRPTAEAALTEMGIRVDQPSPQPVQLNLIVEELSYKVADTQTLPLEITLRAQIAAIADKNGSQQASRYESTKVHKFFKAPNEATNAEIINQIMSETLTRLFNDPRLIDFLRR
ncbi:YajG family lipoprotein [Motiliproteus sp.]|uniref:YajG family lipoprotein n=1 Tax=Motiliproteus sp. TaxID=1898955 RepID=UPI003BAD35B8